MRTETLVIAHRGASGYLPEHTREAKVLAYGQGADYLEQDVVATRDGQLVVLHDMHLDDVTDVAARFAARRRQDGRFYVIDFDLHELQQLRVVERRAPGTSRILRGDRFGDDSLRFGIVTLDEEISLIRELNRTTGRNVGIYPEIKWPDWHRQHGFDLSAALLETLGGLVQREPDTRVFVQCFDAVELRRCREQLATDLPLVQLIDRHVQETVTPEALARIAEYADVVAPHYTQVVEFGAGTAPQPSPLVARVAERGLKLHPYTLRRDDPALRQVTFDRMLEFLLTTVQPDGVFCDQPDAVVQLLDRLARERAEPR